MASTRSKPQDEREAFLANNLTRHLNSLDAAGVEDLKYFAAAHAAGKTVTFHALARWMKEKRGIKLGRRRLATIAEEHGLTPWWSH